MSSSAKPGDERGTPPVAGYDVLFARRSMGIRPGLDIVRTIHASLGHPCAGRPKAHLVGTNGKGSVATMLEYLLRGRGQRVGLFTSPHLQRVTERVRVDGKEVSNARLGAAIDAVLAAEPESAATARPPTRPLSFFEVLTLAALVTFERANAELLVMEAGLGGRLDATRLVAPAVTLVTRIDLDHQAILGDTLPAIAAEKAGAFSPGVPVLTCPQDPSVMRVLEDEARAQGCPLRVVPPLGDAPHGFPGAAGRTNAALALVAAGVFGVAAGPEELVGCVAAGRFERVPVPAGELVFDVAHNPASVRALVETLSTRPAMPTVILASVSADKDGSAIATLLCAVPGAALWTTSDPDQGLVALPRAERMLPIADVAAACRECLGAGYRVVVCGSHRLVGALRGAIVDGDASTDPSDPRTLQG